MADVRKEMRTQRFNDTYNNAKKVPGASNSPSATAAMQAQKNVDAAKQNQLLQAMLNNRQTDAIKNRQASELAVNATIYEKYLAGYNKLVNRLNLDAKDSYSKQQVQASIDEYIAQLDNPKSEVTRDGLTQYLAYTNQTEKYRALLLANPSVDVRNTNNAHMNNARSSASMNIDYAVPSGSTAGIDKKQIANITSAQEAYKLSVDLARQINAVVPDAITSGVIGYDHRISQKGSKKLNRNINAMPTTLLATPITQLVSNPEKIMFILQKPIQEKRYQKILYEIKKGLLRENYSLLPRNIQNSICCYNSEF